MRARRARRCGGRPRASPAPLTITVSMPIGALLRLLGRRARCRRPSSDRRRRRRRTQPGLDGPAIGDLHLRCGEARHLANRLGQRQHLSRRERSGRESAGYVPHASAGAAGRRPALAVGLGSPMNRCRRSPTRYLHGRPHIVLGHHVEHRARRWPSYLEQSIDEQRLPLVHLVTLGGDLREALAENRLILAGRAAAAICTPPNVAPSSRFSTSVFASMSRRIFARSAGFVRRARACLSRPPSCAHPGSTGQQAGAPGRIGILAGGDVYALRPRVLDLGS